MKRLLPLLLIFCLLLTSCVKIEGKGTGDSGGEPSDAVSARDSSAAETSARDKPGDAAQTVQAEPFALYPAYLQIPLGQHVTLDTDTAPAGKRLTWSSSDTSVATVDENGRITPVAGGEAVITCTVADDTSVTSTCGVLVAADGNIYLWEYELEPEEKEALKAALETRSASGEEQAGEELP